MSRMGELATACEAGYAAGRARRQPSTQERARFRSQKLHGAYRSAWKRGRAAAAVLDQLTLYLTGGSQK